MNILSYKDILKDYRRFRQAGGSLSSPENIFDMPNHSYFRIFWHFMREDGLLHPTWTKQTDPSYEDLWQYSTAYNYLLQNDEQQRAHYLKQFIELLSFVNTESPWYFQAVKGIEEAIQRKQTEDMMWKEPMTITIECLEDSVDQRIGTLLDLYRSISWSWERKCEVLPVNLRRFDMSVMVFSSPLNGLHIEKKPNISDAMGAASKWLNVDSNDYAGFGVGYDTSYKVYDLLNCEIEIKSSSGAVENLNNIEGSQQKYVISIKFTDIRESRYNEFIGLYINDAANEDMMLDDGYQIEPKYTERIRPIGIADQLIGMGTKYVASEVNKLLLGNIYGFSLTKVADQVGQLLDGDIGATFSNIKSYTEQKYTPPTHEKRNMFIDTLKNS